MRTEAAIVDERGGAFRLFDVELAELRPDEVLVEVVATGICHSDVAARDGDLPIPPLPAVFGHEGAGRVIAVGDAVTKVAVGDHVVLTFLSCGRCHDCLDHLPSRCDHFISLNMGGSRPDGSFIHQRDAAPVYGSFFGQSSFARHAIACERSVIKVPRDLPLPVLAPLGCGIQTGAGTVLKHLKARPEASIAIFGAGTVGLAAIMGAKIAGCATIIAVDLQQARRDLARELGATHAIDAKADVADIIKEIAAGGVDHAIECSGASKAAEAAIQSIRKGGTVSLVGVPRAGATITVPHFALMAGVTSTVCEGDVDPDEFIPELIEHYRAGRLPLECLIRFFPFEQINEAVAEAEAGRAIKPVLMIGDEVAQ